jgi:hypothetical protein
VEAAASGRRFRSTPLIGKTWLATVKQRVDPFFLVREMRYLSRTKGGNKFAELDAYLRHTQLRGPVLEVLDSDELRVSIAEKLVRDSSDWPGAVLPDLVAGALGQRDTGEAIRLLESERDRGFANRNDLLLLTYLYCLDGKVERAQAISGEIAAPEKDWLVNWLWGKLQAEFGFQPVR